MSELLLDLYRRPAPVLPYWIGGGVLSFGSVALIGGETKIGKSFLALDLMYSLGRGDTCLWGVEQFPIPKPVPVLYAEFELGEYTLQDRVKEKLIEPPPNARFLSKPIGVFLDSGKGIYELKKDIDDNGVRVVVVDPISCAIIGSENSNDDIGRLFRNLQVLREGAPEVSIVLVHHFAKTPKGSDRKDYDPLDFVNFRGASKFTDAVDTIVTCQRVPAARPDEWWRVKTAWRMRQKASPEPITLAIHQGGEVRPAVDSALKAV